MPTNNKIAVMASCNSTFKKAQELSLHLHLPLVKPDDLNIKFPFLLAVNPNRLELHENSPKPTKPVYVDFLTPQIIYRTKYGGGKNQLIAKAVGIKNKKKLTIIDATAGFGIDAFVLASLGCRVTMLERSSIIAALLTDGLERLKANGHILYLYLISIQALDCFNKILNNNQEKPDVIYLDPMYPKREKSALNKKSMRILHEIVGDDSDSAKLLDPALRCAKNRVVVKRPKLADYLSNKKPDLQFFSSGSSRYDVYLTG